MERYGFNPAELFAIVSIDEYLDFLVYALEYRALVVEQMSHEKEQQYLKEHPDPATRVEGYGVILMDCVIHDLSGVGMTHFTGKGKQLLAAAMNVGLREFSPY